MVHGELGFLTVYRDLPVGVQGPGCRISFLGLRVSRLKHDKKAEEAELASEAGAKIISQFVDAKDFAAAAVCLLAYLLQMPIGKIIKKTVLSAMHVKADGNGKAQLWLQETPQDDTSDVIHHLASPAKLSADRQKVWLSRKFNGIFDPTRFTDQADKGGTHCSNFVVPVAPLSLNLSPKPQTPNKA